MGELSYTTINHVARRKLGLSLNEYALADTIYHYANNPKNPIPWCFASKKNLGSVIGVTEQTAHTIINKLLELGLVEKHPELKYLRTTSKYYEAVYTLKGVGTDETKETLVPLKKFEPVAKETLVVAKETLDNNNIYINNNNFNTNVLKQQAAESNQTANALAENQEPQVLTPNGRGKHTGYPLQVITSIITRLAKTLQTPQLAGSAASNRRYATLLLKKHGSVQKVYELIDLIAQDTHWLASIGSVKDLYYRDVVVVNRSKSGQAQGKKPTNYIAPTPGKYDNAKVRTYKVS